MKLWCNGFQGFKKILETNNWNDSNLPDNVAFISICCIEKGNFSPDDFAQETHLLSDNHDNVINLDFDDINGYTLADQFPRDERVKDNPARGINDEQGLQLVQFIEKNKGKDIYVHCSAGISRSQGVVKFILEFYNDYYKETDTNPDNPCKMPNQHVFDVLRKFYAVIHRGPGYKFKSYAVKEECSLGIPMYVDFDIVPEHAHMWGRTKDEIVEVECEVTSIMWEFKDQPYDDDKLNYQGFINFYDMEPCMIYSHAKLFNCCFPYGWLHEVEHNHGLAIRLNVKEINNE